MSRRARGGLVLAAAQVAAVISAMIVAAGDVSAAPTIGNISPPALQVGTTVTLRIDGGDLAANPRLLLSAPIAEQKVRDGGNANRIEIAVKLDAAVQGGIYLARVATDSGVSNAIPIAIDALPNVPASSAPVGSPEPAPHLSQMPAALVGDLTGGNVVRTALAGQKDQRVVVEVESRRLGGKLKPVIRLLDERGVQVAWAQGERRLGGDARLTTRLPATGTYTVELNDLLFRGEGPGRFRLKIGEWSYADLALPLGVQRDTVRRLALLGGNISRPATVDARLLLPGLRPAPWPAGVAVSGTRPGLVVSEHPELVEDETRDDSDGDALAVQPLAAAPIAVSGRLSTKDEQDRYAVPATPGDSLRIEMLAERIGSPVDGVLIVRNVQGGELARGDDQSGTTDPLVNIKVPEGVNSIVVAVEDLLGRGGRDYVYRLSIVPAGAKSFSLSVGQDTVAAPIGGRTLLRVAATRTGYDGPIRLRLAGAPQAVGMTGGEIPAGINTGLLTIAGTQPAAGSALLIGEGDVEGGSLTRVAQAPETPAAETQPWLREELAVAAAGKSPIAADWADDAAIGASPGGKTPTAVKIVRGEDVAGPVRLSLVTSQTVPKKKVDNKEVDDMDKAIRAEAVVVVPPEANEGTVSILVPAEIARLAYDVVVQAELLSADGNQVVATTYTAPRRLRVE